MDQLPESSPWPPAEENHSFLQQLNLPLPVIIAGVVVGLVLIIFLVSLLLRPGSEGKLPTPNATVRSEFSVPSGNALIMDSGTPRPQTTIPISMTLKGLEYSVVPYRIQDDGEWRYPEGQSGTAVWVYGTIVNFAVGLEQTRANLALMDSLEAGDQITLTLSTGAAYQFGFAGRGELASASLDLFDQNRPGLTLVSLGSDRQKRVVVYGEYIGPVEGQSGQTTLPTAFAVGEPAQLGELRVTVLGTSYVYEDPQVPEGWAFFLVDFQVENLSQEVLDPNRFRMGLQDGTGKTYSLNLNASQAGLFGFLSLPIPPNTVAQGTAGYLVPAPLQGPTLSWSFSRLDRPENVAKVLINFESPQETVDPRQMAAVNLTGAELSGDRTVLSVWGTVLNNSDELLEVTMQDVKLEGGGTAMVLRAADPALPWSIEPNSALSFRLSYQRPTTPMATFTVLNQPFEISGIE